jgi:hypothetical protein
MRQDWTSMRQDWTSIEENEQNTEGGISLVNN